MSRSRFWLLTVMSGIFTIALGYRIWMDGYPLLALIASPVFGFGAWIYGEMNTSD